jgi:hypothetical protein
MCWYDLVLSAIATWRLSHMIMWEAGPADILRKARERLGVTHYDDGSPSSYMGPFAEVVSCMWCLSVWVGLVMPFTPRAVKVALVCSAVAIEFDKRHG